MNFNQRLRRDLAEKGPEAAKKWEKDRIENALKFNSAQHQKAEDTIKEFYNQKNSHLVVYSN